jgi:hypothetical protein
MRVKKSNHITVVVCTLGYRNSLLAKKLNDLKSALDNLQISYEIYISHNFDKNQNEELIESQKLSGYDYIYHDIFYDTVEEHILNIFKYFHKRVDDGFIWPISDEDQFNLEDLNRFLRRIKNSRAEAVIANWRYESNAGLPAQQSAINYHSNAPSVKELILETGRFTESTKLKRI